MGKPTTARTLISPTVVEDPQKESGYIDRVIQEAQIHGQQEQKQRERQGESTSALEKHGGGGKDTS